MVESNISDPSVEQLNRERSELTLRDRADLLLRQRSSDRSKSDVLLKQKPAIASNIDDRQDVISNAIAPASLREDPIDSFPNERYRDSRMEDLRSHRFISYFEPEEADQLCQLAAIEEFPDRRVIFEESEVPDFLYLVLDGQVEFRKRAGNALYQTVGFAGANDFFGEFGVLDGQPRSAQAIAAGSATLARIPRDILMEILENTKGRVVLHLFGYIIQRLRATTAQYVNQMVHKEKMVLLGEMVNTIIHDFRSPFTGIHLASSMVKEMHPDEETEEWCDLIQLQIQRVLVMAEEVLEFARGSAVLNKKTVNLAQLLQKFEKLNAVYFKCAEVEFVGKGVDALVHADENKLLRVWQNLVGNAVEAFEGRGGRVEISIVASEQWAEITIVDNGSGIPEAIRPRLFEPFVTHGKRGGTGLGTAIAKSIIDAHDGEIRFESCPSEGTRFWIRLPLLGNSEL